MKKILLSIQIAVVLIFLVKILALTEFIQNPQGASFSILADSPVLAQQPAKTAAKAPQKETATDPLQRERDLAAALQKRAADLDSREVAIRAEEQKLLALKKEITDRIDGLKAIEQQVRTKQEAENTAVLKKYKDLAKVYESIPPERAGVMLERMDIKTAAAITLNMKKDRAGVVWGFLSPGKAIEITREITRSGGFAPESK